MSKPLRIIFAGTPEFSVKALSALAESEHEVVAVLTQPDRPAGRGRQLRASPVKECALQHQYRVLQPQTLKSDDIQDELKRLQADCMVVVAYGLILPAPVLAIPRFGCLNIHASLLPRWRGAAPIQRAIEAGDRQTGVTIMQMDEGLDTGDMLAMEACDIGAQDTAGSMHDKLAEMGADLLLQVLARMQDNTLKPEPQDDSQACYAQKLKKQEALINWQQDAEQIERQIRAFNPWPVAHSLYQGKMLRIWQAHVCNTNVLVDDTMSTNSAEPGQVIVSNHDGIAVACGTGFLCITQLQLAGKKQVSAAQFSNGRVLTGLKLGQEG